MHARVYHSLVKGPKQKILNNARLPRGLPTKRILSLPAKLCTPRCGHHDILVASIFLIVSPPEQHASGASNRKTALPG
jgi:hypothetical protein